MSVKIKGQSKLTKKLARLSNSFQTRVARSAIGAAGTVVAKQARRNAPVGTQDNGNQKAEEVRKPLKKTITKRVKTYRYSANTVAIIGPEGKAAPHSTLVHGGTAPHEITGAAFVNGRFVKRAGEFESQPAIQHPGAAANEFLEDALTTTRGTQLTVIKNSVRKGLDKFKGK
jgi:HK97 gp10 family phage protein